jgi:hypothetical protein
MFPAKQTEMLIVFLDDEFRIIYQMSQSNWKLIEGGALVEALRYKPEGRGFDSRWCH